MGCCSECFNSNKKGEKDKGKNIQNMSISESTPKENTNNKKEYEFENSYSHQNDSLSDDAEEKKVEAKKTENKSENQEELYEQMRQIESGTNNIKGKEEQTSNQEMESSQAEKNEIKYDNSFEENEQDLLEQNQKLNENQIKLEEEKSYNNNKVQLIEDASNPLEVIDPKDINYNSILKAVLLALSYTPEFKEYFLNEYSEVGNKKISKEVNIYLKYIDYLLDDNNKVKGYYDLNNFKNLLINSNFSSDKNQSIVSIIIKSLLENLHNENNNPSSSYDSNSDVIQIYLAKNNSIISKLFCYLTQISNFCNKCREYKMNSEGCYFVEFPMFEVANNLILKNYISPKEIDLYECFEYRHDPNFLNGNYCERCNKTTYEMSVHFYYLPKYLIINLNRGKEKEYLGKVKIHENLDLSKYLMYTNSIPTMKLYAVICSDKPGHFVAFCKNAKTNEWNCYDDYNVTKCSEPEPYKKGKAYVLFYHASQN